MCKAAHAVQFSASMYPRSLGVHVKGEVKGGIKAGASDFKACCGTSSVATAFLPKDDGRLLCQTTNY